MIHRQPQLKTPEAPTTPEVRGVAGRRARLNFPLLRVGSSPQCRAGLQLRRGGGEDLRAIAVQRRIKNDDIFHRRTLPTYIWLLSLNPPAGERPGAEDLPEGVLTVTCGFGLAGKESESSSAVRSTLGAQEHVSGVVACVQALGEVVEMGNQEYFDPAVDHRVDDVPGELRSFEFVCGSEGFVAEQQ